MTPPRMPLRRGEAPPTASAHEDAANQAKDGSCGHNVDAPRQSESGLSTYMQRSRWGYQVGMEREREMNRERDELDSLAAEAGASAVLVGTTALILVVALILGLAV